MTARRAHVWPARHVNPPDRPLRKKFHAGAFSLLIGIAFGPICGFKTPTHAPLSQGPPPMVT